MAFTVGELAKLTGVTVRTLHHYDELGLVRPSGRTAAGYRIYEERDVLRLQQVLLYRELGLALEQIAGVIDDPGFSRGEALRAHRAALVERRGRIDAMLAAVDAALRLEKEDAVMKDQDVSTMFGGFDHSQYEEEVRQKWGETDSYKESARRTKGYGKAEWEQIRRDWEAIYARLAELMREGAAADDARCKGVVEAHRAHIDRWFYPCSVEMHAQLAEMYVSDPRFTANLDKVAPGFARYLRDAIVAAGG
ncbi:MAG: MerR family transcriptional regulator [Deltaproteobacteria bacterium]|nr:MerR family transcriptional regulator [Deltaproteobacteria bacterium]